MKIKLDENLPVRLAILLNNIGHDTHTVHQESLAGHTDSDIWEAAQQESSFLITQDMDFSDSRRFAPGTHHGMLLVRLHPPNRRSLIERVVGLFESEDTNSWIGSFVVVTERKIRILRAKGQQGL
jgi:predicted nuclease of predicted toxin-antitoxin system